MRIDLGFKVFALLSLLILSSSSLYADEGKTSFNLGYFNKLAMNGYDVMSYWIGGQPLEGLEEFSFEYGGAKWLFVSEDNLERFAANPKKFAPQFGGYCAYAAANNALADVDPFAWRIWKNRLYLNYSPVVRRLWAGNIDENITKGENNWPEIDPAK